jgi:hypothetical protein
MSMLLDAALTLRQSGYAVHWLRPHSKAPILRDWAQAPIASPDDLRGTYRPGYNVGVRCGHWSQPRDGYGLVVLDLDIRDPQYLDAAADAVESLVPEGLEVPVVLSGRGMGSRHLWFACPRDALPAKANVTLAEGPAPADKTWRLEILSTGKHLVVPPSVHPETGSRYQWAWPALMPFTPPVVPAAVLQAVETARAAKAAPHLPAPARLAAPRRGGHDSIAAAFCAAVPWVDILEPHGWQFVRQQGDRGQWVRPGKPPRAGISATTTGAVFYCFSTSTIFEPDRGYSKFQLYALLEHGGDPRRAATHLAALRRGRAA